MLEIKLDCFPAYSALFYSFFDLSFSTIKCGIACLDVCKNDSNRFVRASIRISSAASQKTQNSEVYIMMQLHFPHAVFASGSVTVIASAFIVLSL